ncbi:MAG: DNA (cytosine-5-)-methyltransferase [Anaerohalosphaeraceae bacterium]|nr:DNA (cytosine-5-)-methyltransferase [Anaerohalosphaeraceae bacterium]
MESCKVRLTPSAIKYGNLYVSSCKPGFFPKDVYGESAAKKGMGKQVALEVEGLSNPILTDIPKDKKLFRLRGWVKTFIRQNNLRPMDEVEIIKFSNAKYQIKPVSKQFTFIDLFAGIGGTRLAFEKAGGKCVFSSEWDKFAQQTYEANFGKKPEGDIRKISSNNIQDHDILVAGFPCQPFSISGVSKKNSLGKPHGFDDPTQGTLFFEIKRIIEDKRPKAFMLENVKNLMSHDKGKTFKVIKNALESLGYTIHFKVIDAATYVPQHRERIFIVGFKENLQFEFPERPKKSQPKFEDILESKVSDDFILTDHQWKYHQNYAKKHREKGNGFGFGMPDMTGVSRTLSARYYKDGSEIFVNRGKNKNPRRLTPKECANLMGFPKGFKIPVSKTQAYKQFGNSVVVPLVSEVAEQVIKTLKRGGE